MRPLEACRQQSRARPAAFSLIEVLVVITLIAVLLGLLLPAIQATREASRRNACQSNCRQLVLAILNYESQAGTLPAGALINSEESQQGVSWRVLLLPHLEEAALYQKIDVQTTGGAMSRAAGRSASALFQCPSAPPIPRATEIPLTHYEAVGGAGQNPTELLDLDDQFCGDIYTDGAFFPGSHTRLDQVTDGTSYTFALGERVYDLYNWLDGAIWYGAPDVEVCAYATKNLRYPLNADTAEFGYSVSDAEAPPGAAKTMVRNDLFFGSAHPGGAHFALLDGSTRFVDEGIDFLIYQDLASKSGSETSRDGQ